MSKEDEKILHNAVLMGMSFDAPPEGLSPAEHALWKMFCCDFVSEDRTESARSEALGLAESVLRPHIKKYLSQSEEV